MDRPTGRELERVMTDGRSAGKALRYIASPATTSDPLLCVLLPPPFCCACATRHPAIAHPRSSSPDPRICQSPARHSAHPQLRFAPLLHTSLRPWHRLGCASLRRWLGLGLALPFRAPRQHLRAPPSQPPALHLAAGCKDSSSPPPRRSPGPLRSGDFASLWPRCARHTAK
jgi:hypothetical protein